MNTLEKSIAAGISGIAIGFLIVLAFGQQHASFGSFNPTGGGTYVLKSSVSSTQSSVILSSFTEPGSNIPYTMSYLNSDIEYGTINPSSGNSEFVSFTGITQNSDGSATLTGVIRGLARTPGTGGCVASSTLAHSYGGQTQFVLSNPPCFYAEFAKLRNTQSVTGAWTYASTAPPRLDSVAAQASGTYIATTSEFASIAYVDAISIAGVSNATQSVKGVVQIATEAQAASSTALAGGSTGATLVLPTSFATDTPTQSSVSATKLVMSDLTGYIRQTWLDLTKQWNFSSLFATNASTTNATTSALEITTGVFKVNGKNIAAGFGGTGSDGALSISSGTTTINLASQPVVVLNYTTLSITGTGHLAFSSPATGGTIVVLKTTGNATITCTTAPCIDVSNTGAAGGSGCTASGSSCSGSDGTRGSAFYIFKTNAGAGGVTDGTGGTGAALPTTISPTGYSTSTIAKYGSTLWVGGGGGGGGKNNTSNGTTGTGGTGAGALVLEVGGSLNFTGSIHAYGQPGSAAATHGGGGGGGGGGLVKILYGTLTSASGSFVVTGGAGGTGIGETNARGGGGGGSAINAGTDGLNGTPSTGGTGGTGYYSVEKNVDFY